MPKPPFSDGRGLNASMQAIPPFAFEGMTVRTFPLRAKLDVVQQFVDAYLNVAPREVGYFRAFVPYVYLMLVNYGKMSVLVENSGWVAQRELTFTIPLEWYRRVDGRLVFHDWGYLSPFIYVDSKLSMSTGREVYGWPKRMIRLDREGSHWMRDPRSPPSLASISAMVYAEAYAGRQQEKRTVLEIEQSPQPSISQFPYDLRSVFLPWVSAPRAVVGGASLARDLAGVLEGMGIVRAHPGSSPESFAAMAARIGKNLDFYRQPMRYNTLNLKQFRSADDPAYISYQALTNARMEFRRYNRGGLLGDVDMLFGDPSGGYRIFVHRYASEPVIDTLGLEIAEEWAGDGGVPVALLEPVFPFWLDVDMSYNLPETLAFRTKVRDWMDGEGKPLPPSDTVERGAYPRFNTALGAAQEALGGPFEFPGTTLRVMPLLARPDALAAFVDAYLNALLAERGMRFEAWGSYVYLVAASHEGVCSESNNIGAWADRDLTFYVPVKWFEHGKLRTVGLVPVYAYSNSATAAVSASEVSGVPTCKASIDAPETTWLDDGGPTRGAEMLLQMVTELLPIVGEGQRAEDRLLVEIASGAVLPPTDEAGWRRVREGWVATLERELARRAKLPREALEDALALALELLANRQPLNILTVKQFRDGDDPYSACYQSLVQIERTLKHVYDLREIEGPLVVRVHEYSSHPIVKTLGLVAKTSKEDGATRVHELEPTRPFWAKVAMREELGMTICRRAGELAWEDDPTTEEKLAKGKLVPYFAEGLPKVGRSLVRLVDAWVPQRLAPQAEAWRTRGEPALTAEEARAAVDAVEPQAAIEAMLSREWENWGTPRWQDARDHLEKRLANIEKAALHADGVDQQVRLLVERTRAEEVRTRRKDAIADLEGSRGLLAKLADVAKNLGQVEKAQELARYLEALAPGVARGAGAKDAILSGDLATMQALFGSDAMFQVLEEALRVSQFPIDGAPVKRDHLIRWLVQHLAASRKAEALATEAQAIVDGWDEWTRKELTRLFVDESGEPTRAFAALKAARDAAETGDGPARRERVPPEEFLGELWDRMSRDPTLLDRIAGAAVTKARTEFHWVRAAVVHKLAKTEQKPDFCLPVDTLETRERDLAFPDEQRWHEFYVGSTGQEPTKVHGVELPLVEAGQRQD